MSHLYMRATFINVGFGLEIRSFNNNYYQIKLNSLCFQNTYYNFRLLKNEKPMNLRHSQSILPIKNEELIFPNNHSNYSIFFDAQFRALNALLQAHRILFGLS